jgi:hypothetical protein
MLMFNACGDSRPFGKLRAGSRLSMPSKARLGFLTVLDQALTENNFAE